MTTLAPAQRTRILQAIHQNPKLWRRCWPLTDAYGTPGFVPPQGYDWSAFRDSSDAAVAEMGRRIGI